MCNCAQKIGTSQVATVARELPMIRRQLGAGEKRGVFPDAQELCRGVRPAQATIWSSDGEMNPCRSPKTCSPCLRCLRCCIGLLSPIEQRHSTVLVLATARSDRLENAPLQIEQQQISISLQWTLHRRGMTSFEATSRPGGEIEQSA